MYIILVSGGSKGEIPMNQQIAGMVAIFAPFVLVIGFCLIVWIINKFKK